MGEIGAAGGSAEVGGVGLVPCKLSESSTSSAAALLQRPHGFPSRFRRSEESLQHDRLTSEDGEMLQHKPPDCTKITEP